MGTVEDLIRLLSDVTARLETIPADAYGERITLREEERELRGRLREAGNLLSGPEDLESLRRRIREIEHRIEAAVGNRLSASAAAQTGRGGGIDPRDVHMLNRKLDAAAGMANLRKERDRLRARLTSLEPTDITDR